MLSFIPLRSLLLQLNIKISSHYCAHLNLLNKYLIGFLNQY